MQAFANPEVERSWAYTRRSVDRIIACCQAVPPGQLDWRPPAPEANCLAALATHAMGNLEHRLLGLLCGERRGRDRDSEFTAERSTPENLSGRWQQLRREIAVGLSAVSADDLDRSFEHPERGIITGHDILLIAARHMAEHAGQAELTRDLLNANLS